MPAARAAASLFNRCRVGSASGVSLHSVRLPTFFTDVFPTVPAPTTGQRGEQEMLPDPGDIFARPPVPVSALKHYGIGGGSSSYDSETSANTVRNMHTGTSSDSVADLLDQLRCAKPLVPISGVHV